MSPRLRAVAIVAAILILGAWAAFGLRIGSDLARFMPAPNGADEQLLIDEIGRGAGNRLLLVGIAAADDASAAALSRGLRASLQSDEAFARVLNGELDLDAEIERLLPLRFTHSPGMDAAGFDAAALATVLGDRLADLGSVGGQAFEALLARDPHYLTLAMAESWQPRREPALREGVWFAPDAPEALLLVETRAAGFDPDAQAQAMARLHAAYAALDGSAQARLTVTGPGSFSARMAERVGSEAGWLGGIATVCLMAMLLLAYRSPLFVIACSLPLACAAAAGLLALRVVFGDAHGITLAFAVTLIGVAQDYPVHLLSHARPGEPLRATAHALWPALRLGVASTVIAYMTLFSAEAEGLAQLAVFTIAGLLTAGAVTRYVLPDLLPLPRRDVLDGRWFPTFARWTLRRHLGAWVLLPVLALVAAAVWLAPPRAWWNNDLATLTPLPKAWLDEDLRLRAALATPDARHVLVLEGEDIQAVLRTSERLAPALDALVANGALADHGLPSRYRPSDEVQRWRLSRLPPPDALRAALADAGDATGFDAAFFEPMVADVRAASAPDALAHAAQSFAATAAGARVEAALHDADGRAYAVVDLSGLVAPDAVAAAIEGESGARLLDVKQAAESMVAAFRSRVLAGLGVAALALLVVLGVALSPVRALRVLPPVIAGLVVTVAILRLAGVELTLFHLIALMLSAGLGMDYALFFGHADAGADEQRTLHAVILSALSTALVFGLLAASAIPVLRAIGLTVSIGVCTMFVLAVAMARAPKDATHA